MEIETDPLPGAWDLVSWENRARWARNISESKKAEWIAKSKGEKAKIVDKMARIQKLLRPKTRNYRGRFNGAMDIPSGNLFEGLEDE